MPPKKLRSKRSFEGEEEGQVSSMPRVELAKMLNYFRYHGTISKSTKAALKDDCLAAKSARERLAHEKKVEFLERFKSSKKRDLTWVQNFVSKTSKEDSSTITQTEEWLNSYQILALNAMSEEQADRVCQPLIKMSEEQFGYTAEKCTHPIEILSIWLYKRHLGVRHDEKKSKTETWSDKASGSSSSFKKTVTAAGPSSSSAIGGVEIKVEHPQLVELRCWDIGQEFSGAPIDRKQRFAFVAVGEEQDADSSADAS